MATHQTALKGAMEGRARANLAMARFRLASIEKDLKI